MPLKGLTEGIKEKENRRQTKKALTVPYKSKILSEFDVKATKMTEEEIQQYLLGLNKNWENIINLFNKDYMRSSATKLPTSLSHHPSAIIHHEFPYTFNRWRL